MREAVLEPSPSASRMRARAMHRERTPTVTHSAGSPCDRDTLHLDQHFRARQAGDGYQGARWEIVGEDLPAELGEPSPSRASVMNTVIVTKSARLAPASSSVPPTPANTSRTCLSKSAPSQLPQQTS